MKKCIILAVFLLVFCSLAYADNDVRDRRDSNDNTVVVSDYVLSLMSEQSTTPDIHKGMKYKEIKHLYNPKEYIKDIYDPYNPAVAGVCSFLIPGLGQILDGEIGRGILFLVGAGFTTGAAVAFSQPAYYSGKTANYYDWQAPVSIACLCGALAIDIWAIVDAVKVGKIKNMYNQDLRKLFSDNNINVSLSPTLAYVPMSNGLTPTAGVALRVTF